MEKVKAVFKIFLWVSLIGLSWTSPYSYLDDEDDAIALPNDLETHFRDVQDDLNAAAEEYKEYKNTFDTSSDEDEMEAVFAQKVGHEYNLEDKQALLQHIRLIHNEDLNSVSSEEFSENEDDEATAEDLEQDESEELDKTSMDDIALHIQNVMEDRDIDYDKDTTGRNIGEIMRKPTRKTDKKISKETKKILGELTPGAGKDQVMEKAIDSSSKKISEETNKILDELNPEEVKDEEFRVNKILEELSPEESRNQVWKTDDDIEVDEATNDIIRELEEEENKRKISKDTNA